MTFLEARDFLLCHRTEYEIAYRGFRWPRQELFNWALDYFDLMARDNSRIGLWIVDDSGLEVRLSFAELAERSDRVANFLRALGVRRGDRVLLMLGNEAPLWDALLACFKLGAVVIPSSVLLGPDDLRDRLERGAVRHLIAGEAHIEKFASLGEGFTRIVVGGHGVGETARLAGWCSFEEAYQASAQFQSDGPTRGADPLLLYFTSGATAFPEACVALARELPHRPPFHAVLVRASTRRRALEYQLARMGQARVELRVRALGSRRVRIRR
jgi:acetyl-CoA synthetase